MCHAKCNASGQFCLQAEVMPLVSWEESKGARLAEAGEVRDMNWEAGRSKAGGYSGTSHGQTEQVKGQSKNVLTAYRSSSVTKYRLFLTMRSLLNLVISYGLGKWSQVVPTRCGSYYIWIYWTCFRSTHLKIVMSLLFTFPFQNTFSALKQIIKINHKGIAEASMFSSRFAWLMISPDRQSISWWKPGKTDHSIQNKLRCCVFKMLLL